MAVVVMMVVAGAAQAQRGGHGGPSWNGGGNWGGGHDYGRHDDRDRGRGPTISLWWNSAPPPVQYYQAPQPTYYQPPAPQYGVVNGILCQLVQGPYGLQWVPVQQQAAPPQPQYYYPPQ